MSNRFSKQSQSNLETCHPLLRELFLEVLKVADCSIIEGHRGEEAQDRAYMEGYSKLMWPKGKHNKLPSIAVDVAPYPLNWRAVADGDMRERLKFYFFAGIVYATAKRLNIDVRWGGDWDGDWDYHDQSFDDLFHWELILA